MQEPEAVEQQPSLDERGLPRGWVLQVASFSREQNAQEVTVKLKEMGYKAYTRKVATDEGELVRVYIGPKLSADAFADDRPLIDKTFDVKSMVVKYEQ